MPNTSGQSQKNTASDPLVRRRGTSESRHPTGGTPLELTSFVGREREIAELEGLLAGETRLLTLTGPGGSGKTRLALEVATQAVERFEDGVWWVELAPISDPDLLPQAVAQVLHVHEHPGRSLTDAIAHDLRDLDILLVLDNCEHLLEACAGLVEVLLHRCAGLEIVATSREPLGVKGEGNFPVSPLSLPDPGRQQSFEDLAEYEAIRLFVERARDVAPDFGLTEQNADAVARLCRRLDGMPLAVELAAARVRVLSVEQISSRLEESFALLAGGSRTAMPRQRTLGATIDWSYDLLSEKEQALFRNLAVFTGRFGMEAAEAVCSGENLEREGVFDLLTHLVEKSLVLVVERDGEARYRLLETVRQYGKEKLRETGEAEPVQERHAKYYLAFAEEAEPELKGERQAEWLGRLERDSGNLRTALEWSSEGGNLGLALRLSAALERFWWARGYLSEGRRWLDRSLGGSGAAPASARALALNEAGWLALWQADHAQAVEFLEVSLGSFKELEDERGIATALTNLGHTVLHQDDKDRLRALCGEAEALRGRFVDRWAIAELLIFLGMATLYEGDHRRAVALLEESMASFQDLGDTQRVTICLTYLWMAALEGGDHQRTAALLEEDFRRLQRLEIKPQIQIYDGLMGLAVVAAITGRSARATRLCGAAETLREAIGLSLLIWDHTPADYEAQLNTARAQLEEPAREAAWSEGRAMSPEEAVNYALSDDETPGSSPPSTTSYPAGLSAREAEVLKLVAEGLTNPQVAERLYLSPRTVAQHLRSIYRKLGVPSRAAAAREASKRGLI
jgi:predicted ATPase/DNA-binding CsgD family transcriptional regulator